MTSLRTCAGEVRQLLKWADGKAIKNEVDLQVRSTLRWETTRIEETDLSVTTVIVSRNIICIL